MQRLPPVFKKWIRDDLRRIEKAYFKDTTPYSADGGKTYTDCFEPERYIKDSEDIEKCETILKENFSCLQAYFLQYLARSKKYPELELRALAEALVDVLNVYNAKTGEHFSIEPAQLEIAYLSATRHDSKANRSLCRGEFLELVVRLAHIKFRKSIEQPRAAFSTKERPSPRMQDSTRQHELDVSVHSCQSDRLASDVVVDELSKKKSIVILQSPKDARPTKGSAASPKSSSPRSGSRGKPSRVLYSMSSSKHSEVHEHLALMIRYGFAELHAASPVTTLRREIQDDPLVVRALAMRLKELKSMFEFYKDSSKFRWLSAMRLFEMEDQEAFDRTLERPADESHFWYPLNAPALWPPFVHCMMTVLAERKRSSKYEHLRPAEYYEWIARIAFLYADLRKQPGQQPAFRHDQVAHFIDRLVERQKSFSTKRRS